MDACLDVTPSLAGWAPTASGRFRVGTAGHWLLLCSENALPVRGERDGDSFQQRELGIVVVDVFLVIIIIIKNNIPPPPSLFLVPSKVTGSLRGGQGATAVSQHRGMGSAHAGDANVAECGAVPSASSFCAPSQGQRAAGRSKSMRGLEMVDLWGRRLVTTGCCPWGEPPAKPQPTQACRCLDPNAGGVGLLVPGRWNPRSTQRTVATHSAPPAAAPSYAECVVAVTAWPGSGAVGRSK